MSVAAGLGVMQAMFEAEITAIAGPKGKHDPDRAAVRHGTGRGAVTLGGRRMPVSRPRARTLDGHEVPLESYAHFAADDLLSQVVMERMLAGVATRRHVRTAEPVGAQVADAAKSTSRSAVSRRFVRETETALAELMARDLTELDIKVLMLDGEHMADRCVVVALAITSDGTKIPVGLWDGSTENKTVVRTLLADLVERGLSFEDGLLVVIDGAKALAAAVREVFGAKALIQRCTLHKRRNLADHLPDKEKDWVDAKLVKAFGHPDPEQGLRNAKHLAGLLEKSYPGAAASLREGLDEMFTVARLGIDGRLAKTLTTSNPIVISSPSRAVLHVRHGPVRACGLRDGRGYLPLVHRVDHVEERCTFSGWRCLRCGPSRGRCWGMATPRSNRSSGTWRISPEGSRVAEPDVAVVDQSVVAGRQSVRLGFDLVKGRKGTRLGCRCGWWTMLRDGAART